MKAPFPWFGGKRTVTADVWRRLGKPKQYIEPFCGSAAMLLSAPEPASLEVAGDLNGFIANFWRAVKHQPGEVAKEADYPVSHIDQGARHRWLMEQRDRLGAELQDAEWPGDARVAGWWLWGQCSWIGSGWCEWSGKIPHVGNAGRGVQAAGQIPHVTDAGRGVQAAGRIPHVSNAGMGVQAAGKIPFLSSGGMGIQSPGAGPATTIEGLLTSGGRAAWVALHALSERLERVRLIHGAWDRCLNRTYGGASTAVFLDPPYRAYEALYGIGEGASVAGAVEDWARENADARVVLCGHLGDYPSLDAAGWDCVPWKRQRLTYGGGETTDKEALWYSPACLPAERTARQTDLFADFGGGS